MKVLYFAQAAVAAGCREESWTVSSPLTIEAFWGRLVVRHPAMAALRRACRVARNQEFTNADTLLQAGDEVAILPPVSGG